TCAYRGSGTLDARPAALARLPGRRRLLRADSCDSLQPLQPRPALGRSLSLNRREPATHPSVHRTHELVCPARDALAKAIARQRRLAKGEVLAGDALDCQSLSPPFPCLAGSGRFPNSVPGAKFSNRVW